MKLRHIFKPLVKYIVETSENISFWLGKWHPMGPLLSVFSPTVVFASGIPLHAPLSKVIQNGHWGWPASRSSEILEIQRAASHIFPTTHPDTIIWSP